MFASVISICICLLLPLVASQRYSIAAYDTTIVNPSHPDRDIPVEIHYPNITSKTTTFPTFIFGHCYVGPANFYDYVWQNLVPLGYIVVLPMSVDHGSPDAKEFAIDIRYTLDWMHLNCTTTCSFGHLIGDRSSVSGHSLGGGAAVIAISEMDLGQKFQYTFDSMITLSACAGATYQFESASKINKDAFLMDGSHDCMCPPSEHADIYYQNISNSNGHCKYESLITNATHCDFADLSPADDASCLELEENSCPNGKEQHLTVKEQITISTKYLKLWLNATMYNYGDQNKFDDLNQALENDLKSGAMNTTKSNNCGALRN